MLRHFVNLRISTPSPKSKLGGIIGDMYVPTANSSTKSIVYDNCALSKTGSTNEIREVWVPKVSSWSPTYEHLTQPFSLDHFTSPRLPIDLGPFDLPLKDLPRILRMTVKPVDSNVMFLPEELSSMREFLIQVLEYDKSVNSNFFQNEVHLTLDTQVVEPNHTQRFPGWHVDGLQGGKFKNKLQAEHSYILASEQPTEFCLQPFYIKHYNEDITNFFKAFDQQAREENVYAGLENHLYLMDAYMVHRTPVVTVPTLRSFLRITVANAPLPIEFNTLNPLLRQEKPAEKLDIRDWLRAPDSGVNYEFYGLEKSSVEPVICSGVQDNNVPQPSLSGKGTSWDAPDYQLPKVQPNSPLYTDMMEPFNTWKYTTARLPIDLGVTNTNGWQDVPNVLRMPIKWWDSDTVYLPAEMSKLKAVINRALMYDRCHNPLFHNMSVHITFDRREIAQGKTHRYPGWHGDDLQAGSFPDKELSCHSYILTSNPGTEFCIQPFFLAHLDDTHESLFREFDRQVKTSNIVSSRPDHLYLMDPYMVHRTPETGYSGARTFLRITVSTKGLLLPHNTLNPLYADRQEEYEELPYPHLNETRFTQMSDKSVPYSMYGITRY